MDWVSLNRRRFLSVAAPVAWGASHLAFGDDTPSPDGKLGIVTASLSRYLKEDGGKLTLLELPAFLRNELDLEILDFNSANFPSWEPGYLEKLRSRIEDSGCIATNLKMNQKVDMNAADPGTREQALKIYRETIDAAAFLGIRWVRPLPRPETPDMDIHVSSYQALIDYAGERGITVLIENFGWMMDDPESIPRLARRIGVDTIAVGVDTGNWSTNEIRYDALEKAFPLAVTCDFKAKAIAEDGSHAAYDLKRCFDIGWQSGFRGPWCFEHASSDWDTQLKNLRLLRDRLREWMKS